ncbi:hypothetical protein HDV02_005179, partial [Globomyces sp. JEL0801]
MALEDTAEPTVILRKPLKQNVTDDIKAPANITNIEIIPSSVKGKFASPDAVTKWRPPTFTLKQVREKIPAHCFKSNVFISLGYVLMDLSLITGLVYFATLIDTFPDYLYWPAWTFYWIAQALPGVGIWILAHECGHGAFSQYKTVNAVVGWVLHSIVLIPFFSWKYSHSKHHKGTGHFKKDMVYLPATRTNCEQKYGAPVTPAEQKPIDPRSHSEESLFQDTSLTPLVFLISILLFGFPVYLLNNMGGQNYGDKWVSHYFPNAPIFEKHQYNGVVLSNIGLLTWIGIQVALGFQYGAMVPVFYFVIPWMQVNAWLVLITYLQHTDPEIPHYQDKEWDFLRGALATVDRDWGFLNFFFHHITDTHVVHHMFSTMPFYHAQEATLAVKDFLGDHYHFDDNNPIVSVWKSVNTCR